MLLVRVTEGIIAFAWEPNGSRFAVLHGESPRINASFYHVKSNGKIDLISKYQRDIKSLIRQSLSKAFKKLFFPLSPRNV